MTRILLSFWLFCQIAKLGWKFSVLPDSTHIKYLARNLLKVLLHETRVDYVTLQNSSLFYKGRKLCAELRKRKTGISWFRERKKFNVLCVYNLQNYIKPTTKPCIHKRSDVAYKFLLITIFKGVSWWRSLWKGKWKQKRAEEKSCYLRNRFTAR